MRRKDVRLLLAFLPRSDECLIFFAVEKQRKCAPLSLVAPDPVSRFVLDLLSLLRRAYPLSLEVG